MTKKTQRILSSTLVIVGIGIIFYPDRPYYLPVKYREQMAIMKELLRLKEINSLDTYQAQWFREKK